VKYKIWLKKSVIDEILLDGNKCLPKETGGIIMGYSVSALEFVITDLIGAGKEAIHGYNSFEPDQLFHLEEVKRIYQASNGFITYLGDWHTHPNSYPYLSSKDKKTICTIANYEKARLLNPLMLIASPPKNDFKVWVYKKTKLLQTIKYSECTIIIFG
jgi:integrative and conjugative element protein (TIGR02256 family)